MVLSVYKSPNIENIERLRLSWAQHVTQIYKNDYEEGLCYAIRKE